MHASLAHLREGLRRLLRRRQRTTYEGFRFAGGPEGRAVAPPSRLLHYRSAEHYLSAAWPQPWTARTGCRGRGCGAALFFGAGNHPAPPPSPAGSGGAHYGAKALNVPPIVGLKPASKSWKPPWKP